MYFNKILIVFFAFILPANAVVVLDQMMSKDEQRITGVSKLNHHQKLALEEWLNKNFVYKPNLDQYPKDLYLSENINGGAQLRLSDATLYEVAPDDIAKASLWITPFPLRVISGDDPNYPQLIINLSSGSTVKVKKIDALPSTETNSP